VRNGQPTPPPHDENKQNKRKFSQMNVAGPVQQYQQQHQQQQCQQQLSQQQQYQQQPQQLSQQLPSPPYDDEKAKRERFLERNRLAASKCREKKKKNNQQLEQRFHELQNKNTELNTEIEDLRAEGIALKNELLRHSECGDPAISIHLSHMVQNITARDH
ncbi:bZIP transcription factor atfB, partial [Aspergillus fijiensis CBS 313.89]